MRDGRPTTATVARAFLEREFRVSLTYRLLFLAQALGIVFAVVTTWFVAKIVDPASVPSAGYFPFVIAAMLASTFLVAALPGLARNAREEQQRGTLEAIFALGVGPVAYSLGVGVAPVLFAVPQVVLIAVLGAVLGVELSEANWSLAMVSLTIGVVAFAGLGLIGGAAVMAFRRAEAIVGWLVVALTFAAGEYFPPDLLPGWVRTLSLLSPFTWCLDLVRGALLDGWGWAEAADELVVLSAIAAVSCASGVAASILAMRRARRRGTLALY